MVTEKTKQTIHKDLRSLRIDRERKVRTKSRAPRRVLLGATVLLVLAGAVLAIVSLDLKTRLGFGVKTVRVSIVGRQGGGGVGGASPVLAASGFIAARSQVELGSKITGRVTSLEVKEGDLVQRGQIVARLDDAEVRADVRRAEANVDAAKARLAEIVAGSRPQEINRSKAEVDRLDADLKNAEIRLRRTQQLVAEGVVARQELDNDRSRYEMARAARRAANENLSLARDGSRREEVDLGRAEVRRAEGDLAQAQAQAENTIIRAPITGTIIGRYVDVGEMVTTGFTSERGAKQSLVTIADTTDLQVELDINETNLARVQLEQPVTVTADAYPERLYKGVVEYIASVASRQKATVQVKVRVLDADAQLRPDMGVKVSFYQPQSETPQSSARVVLPKAALRGEGDQTYILLAKDGRAVRQPVRVGRAEGEMLPVLEGLQGGESVVLDRDVADGDKIKVQQ